MQCAWLMQHDSAHRCVSDCLQTVGLTWEVDDGTALGVLPSLLIVGLLLVPLCALFSGLTLGAIHIATVVVYASVHVYGC